MKRLILCLFLSLFILGPLYAQEEEDVPEEDVEQEAPAEEGEVEAPSGGGGGGSSGLMFGVGSLYTFSLSSDQTDAADDAAFFPRGTVFFDMGGFALGGELLLENTFKVKSTGGISSSKIAESDLTFTGMAYSVLVKIGDDLGFYGGYGFNQFDISRSESGAIGAAATSAGIGFSQKIKAKSGTQIILGVDWELAESVVINGDFRLMMVPADLTTSITPSGSTTATVTEKAIDFNFTILSIGASYLF